MAASEISRRSVLLGGAGLAGLAVVAACGGSDKQSKADSTQGSGEGDRSLLAFFDVNSTLVVGSLQRATFGIGDSQGALVKDAPATLAMTITRPNGKKLPPLNVARYDKGLPRAYYPVEFTPPVTGNYQLATKLDGHELTAAFRVLPTDAVKLISAGDPMPATDTPTVTDHRGVEPICTASPQCPMHEVNLRDALAAKSPTVLLVSTPAFCQTAICGPVLDVLLGARDAAPKGTAFIHAEVYQSAKDAEANGPNAKLAPILDALQLPFEPALFLVGSDGKLVRRLDVIFDDVELRSALKQLS